MLPKINDILYIQVASTDEKEGKLEYKSRVSDIQENSMLIEVPLEVSSGRLKRLYLGDELSVHFISDEGIKHFFNTYVLGFSNDVISLVRVRKPELNSITKIQRRNFLRVNAELEIAVQLKDESRFVTFTEDVGGGGISLNCEASISLENDEVLECWLLVPFKNGAIEHVPFEAQIVRINTLQNGRKRVMLKFVSISDMERQKIIRYCFERQLEIRNRL